MLFIQMEFPGLSVGVSVGLSVCLSVCHDREPCKNG